MPPASLFYLEFSRRDMMKFVLVALAVIFLGTSGFSWFENYDFRRNIEDNTSDNLILPIQESDIDGNGANETFYGQSGSIYFDNETDFAFARRSGQRCGFQTSPEYNSSCSELDSGLIHFYTFDNDVVRDVVGSGDGSKNGVTTGVEGKINSAYSFDSGDKIDNTFTLPKNTDITVSYWIKADSQSDGPVLHSWTGSNAYGIVTGVSDRWGDSPSDSFSFGLRYGNGNANMVYTDQAFADNTWHHVVGVKPDDARASDLRMYVDGQRVSTSYTSGRNDGRGELPSYDVHIGHNQYDNNYLAGDLDSIRIYERGLSEEEINDLYEASDNSKASLGNLQGGVYSSNYDPQDSEMIWYNNSLNKVNVSAEFNDIYDDGGFLEFYNSSEDLIDNITVSDGQQASSELNYDYSPSTEYSWSVVSRSRNESVNSTVSELKFETGSDFTNYNYYRPFVNHTDEGLDRGVVLPFNTSDIDENEGDELFYGSGSRIYFDNDSDFVFAEKEETCSFQTFPSKISNCSSIKTDLVSYFPFDNNNSWNPLNPLNGTIKGDVETGYEGKIGDSYFFNGSGYIALEQSYSSKDINSFSVSSWVKMPEDGGGWSVLDFDRSEYFNVVAGIPQTDSSGEGDYVGFHSTDSSGSTSDMWSETRIRDGKWHHLAMVFNGTHKKIFIDGQLDKTQSIGDIGTGATRYGFIGEGSEASSFDGERNNVYFEGSIDDLRFYDKGISDKKVSLLYNKTNKTVQRPYFGELGRGTIKPSICDYTATKKECVSNQTHIIDGQVFEIDTSYESTENAVFEAFENSAKLMLNGSSRISGIWRGSFDINSDKTVLSAGARLRPGDGTINIQKAGN